MTESDFLRSHLHLPNVDQAHPQAFMMYINGLMCVSTGKERAELDLDAAIDLCENQAGFQVDPQNDHVSN